MRQDVFDTLLATEKNLKDSLQGEAKRYLEKRIKIGKRNGMLDTRSTFFFIKFFLIKFFFHNFFYITFIVHCILMSFAAGIDQI